MKSKMSTSQSLRLKVNGILGTMTFEDGTVKPFTVGDTVQYTVPENSTGRLTVDLDFEMDATVTNETTFTGMAGEIMAFLDSTVTYDIPCAYTESCYPGTRQVAYGTNGPVFTLDKEISINLTPESRVFPLSVCGVKSFSTVLDVQYLRRLQYLPVIFKTDSIEKRFSYIKPMMESLYRRNPDKGEEYTEEYLKNELSITLSIIEHSNG